MRKEFGVSNRNGDSWRFQPKMKEAPSNEEAFLFQRHPHREAIGGGVLVTVGACSPGSAAALALRRRVLLRERGT